MSKSLIIDNYLTGIRIRPARRSVEGNFSDDLIRSQDLQHRPYQVAFSSYEPVPLLPSLLVAVKPPVVQEPPVDHQHTVVRQLFIEAAGERFLALRVRADLQIQQEMRPERHQTNDPCLRIRALTVCTTRRQSKVRAILVTIRYPDSRAEGAQYRQTAPTVSFDLLTSMTSHNSVKQVFEGGDLTA